MDSLRTISICTRRPRRQVSITRNMAAAIKSGSQPPSGIFKELAARKRRSVMPSAPNSRTTPVRSPTPLLARHQRRIESVDHHHARHRNAISRRQGARILEDQHDQHHADGKHDIHARHINLAIFGGRGVADFHARQLSQLHRLLGHGKDAGDDGLAGDDRRHRRQDHHGQMYRMRHDGEEGAPARLGSRSKAAPWPK